MNLEEFDNIKDVLRTEYHTRLQRNPAYSLRAFARDIEVSPSRLSEILNKEESMSVSTAKKVSKHIFSNENDRTYFIDLAIVISQKNTLEKDNAEYRIQRYRRGSHYHFIQEDDFKCISEWYHLAIIECFYLKYFQPNAVWIAKKLKLPIIETKNAIARLAGLKILEVKEDHIGLLQQKVVTNSTIPSESIRNFHRQIIMKALTAIDEQNIQKRNLSSLILSVNSQDIEQIKQKIMNFNMEIRELAASSSDKDTLYAFSTQFFEL